MSESISEKSLKKHYEWHGKLEIKARASVKNADELSLAYTPGVAAPCLEIQKDLSKSYELTRRFNTVAVITDGTAVLGLGDIGPLAGMPVMEGKCVLFKEFADVDAFPICIGSKEPDEIVKTVELISDSFGGINLEDISAPRCFEIEERLKEICDIPVFHDDQHGTAIIVGAAVINSLKIVKKDISKIKCAVCGAGAAGTAIMKHLLKLGVKQIVACDINGIICDGHETEPYKIELAKLTNKEKITGGLAEAVKGADIFIGVSAPGILTKDMVRSMAKDPCVFALANPTPEIFPADAYEAGAKIVGTGRSDYPNQINNVLAFPGVFRGALDVRAREITDSMKLAASYAIAGMIKEDELAFDNILPKAFDKNVAETVARAVAEEAKKCGAARI